MIELYCHRGGNTGYMRSCDVMEGQLVTQRALMLGDTAVQIKRPRGRPRLATTKKRGAIGRSGTRSPGGRGGRGSAKGETSSTTKIGCESRIYARRFAADPSTFHVLYFYHHTHTAEDERQLQSHTFDPGYQAIALRLAQCGVSPKSILRDGISSLVPRMDRSSFSVGVDRLAELFWSNDPFFNAYMIQPRTVSGIEYLAALGCTPGMTLGMLTESHVTSGSTSVSEVMKRLRLDAAENGNLCQFMAMHKLKLRSPPSTSQWWSQAPPTLQYRALQNYLTANGLMQIGRDYTRAIMRYTKSTTEYWHSSSSLIFALIPYIKKEEIGAQARMAAVGQAVIDAVENNTDLPELADQPTSSIVGASAVTFPAADDETIRDVARRAVRFSMLWPGRLTRLADTLLLLLEDQKLPAIAVQQAQYDFQELEQEPVANTASLPWLQASFASASVADGQCRANEIEKAEALLDEKLESLMSRIENGEEIRAVDFFAEVSEPSNVLIQAAAEGHSGTPYRPPPHQVGASAALIPTLQVDEDTAWKAATQIMVVTLAHTFVGALDLDVEARINDAWEMSTAALESENGYPGLRIFDA